MKKSLYLCIKVKGPLTQSISVQQREAAFHNCSKKGHFQMFCRSKKAVGKVYSDTDTDSNDGAAFSDINEVAFF